MGGIASKLRLALLISLTLPLGASVALLTMAVDSALQMGINRQVHQALERAPAAYRALFDALKSDFEHSTDAMAGSPELRALIDSEPDTGRGPLAEHLSHLVSQRADLVELRLVGADGQDLAEARAEEPVDPAQSREWTEERELSWRDSHVRLTARWIAPRAHFASFQRAGETLERYETLEQGRFHLRNRYVAVYLALVGIVLLLAAFVGGSISRAVSRRITHLCEATRKVASGDLTTQVPVGPKDEVGELASAFNNMVGRLHESRERIEYLKRLAAWQQFARRLAHEIKNPLTPIQLAVQELNDRYRGGNDSVAFERVLQQATEIVTEEVESLRFLVSEFSAFAKLPAVNPQPIGLRSFLEGASPSLKLLATDDVAVDVELPEAGEAIEAQIDHMLMKRVLDNLVRNGVEAIQESEGATGRVVVRGGAEAGQPIIEIEDDGPGIQGEDRARVFEPYHTTKKEGTGLGLAIVKKIVLEHGGHVTLAPDLEKGSKFVVRLCSS